VRAPRLVRPAIVATAALLALAGCGGSGPAAKPASTQPARRAHLTMGTLNFPEGELLGELYAQALRAKGYRVRLKLDVGTAELVHQAMLGGALDLYPEYTGIILSDLARDASMQRSVAETYRKAKAFEATHGLVLLDRTPFQDRDSLAVKPDYARQYGLRAVPDLKRLPPGATIGAPPEFRTRLTGLVGLRRIYGITNLRFHGYSIPDQYAALDERSVQVIDVSTTDGQLRRRGAYRLLRDPKNMFGFENAVPIVSRAALRRAGPLLARTLNAVSAKLTVDVMRRMNVEVMIEHRPVAAVAREFLSAQRLI
jgi:osmoprotectant transport system substrate-binding protein